MGQDTENAESSSGPPRLGPSFFFGLLIIVIGAVLLAERLGFIDSGVVFQFWPLALAAAGLAKIASSRYSGGRIFGAILVVTGVAIFAQQQGVFWLDWALLWPIALISVGLILAYRSLSSRTPGNEEDGIHGQGFRIRKLREDEPGDESYLNEWAMFGGGRLVNSSQFFRGGDAFVMFGGIEIDLTSAELVDSRVEIQANAIFGGVELHVPAHWNVVSRGVPIFGGYEDKRVLAPGNPPPSGSQLIVRGFAIFGGVEINSKGA